MSLFLAPPAKRMRGRLINSQRLLAFLLIFLFVIPSVFYSRQNQTQKVLRHDAAAVVKLVPVRVLDASGRPVLGLKKGDFILYDNKERKTITEFEVHESGESRVLKEAAPIAGQSVQQETNRKYFFVLDMQGSDIYGNMDAKKAALEFVQNSLKPGDEASVMAFGALTGLVLKQYLTSDLEKVRKAIGRSVEMPTGIGVAGGGGINLASPGISAGDASAEQEKVIAEVDAKRAVDSRSLAGVEGGLEEGSGRSLMTTVSVSASANVPFTSRAGIQMDVPGIGAMARTKADFDMSMSELAKSLKYVSGSKSVVYFSTRIPGRSVGRLFAEANATIYAVNTNSVPDKGGGAGAAVRREIKKKQGEALKDFAEASGGHYFAAVKDAKAIAEDVEALSGNYYVLGYYINLSWDGRSHEITVEVKKPGLEVLAQQGYSNPKPFAAWSDLEKKLQLFDLALSDKPVATDALELPVEALCGSAMAGANTIVLSKLTVDERTGIPPEKAEICTLVFDKDHKIVLAERAEMNLAPYPQKTLFPYLLAELKPGEYECRVAVRGLETGQTAANRLPFEVQIPASAAMSFSSPLLLVPGNRAEFVRMSRPGKNEKEAASIIRFYPFLPMNCTPLLRNLGPDAPRIWALLPVCYGDDPQFEASYSVRLFSGEAEGEIPIDWRVIDSRRKEPGMDFVLIEMGLPDLNPGVYRLEFSGVEINTGAKAVVSRTIEKK